jgi:hypothetical protein
VSLTILLPVDDHRQCAYHQGVQQRVAANKKFLTKTVACLKQALLKAQD